MKNLIEVIGYFILAVLMIAIVIGFPLMWLWNWLMPVIFGLPHITFWQAVGLNMIASALFGNKNTTRGDKK